MELSRKISKLHQRLITRYMKHFLLFAALGLSSLAISQTLYEEGFEGFSAGDYVSDSPVWITWTNGQEGSTGDAQISDEQAHSGSNSVHIYAATAAGGPMDVVLLAGLDEGVYDASMWMYIPDGSSAYYNVQEDQSPGVAGPLKLRLPLLVICKLSWMVQLLQPALSRSTRGSKLVT